ncbi:MAG: hypothetical protein JSW54_13445, partial [Fidelibacterota bacterium]
HTPSYELEKLKVDPGIHDLWGYSLKRGWDIIEEHPWVVGCIAFAWRDPYIRDRSDRIVPALHHESRWGVVDESFRIKPEYHHLAKVYAPVQVSTAPIRADLAEHPVLTVENQYDFINLSSIHTQWVLLGPEGTVQEGQWDLDVTPHTSKELPVPVIPEHRGSYILQLSFRDSSDRLVQKVQIPFVWSSTHKGADQPSPADRLKVLRDADLIGIAWSNGIYWFNRVQGLLRYVEVGDEKMELAGPQLNQRLALSRPGRWFDWQSGVATATENWTRRVFAQGLEEFKVTDPTNRSEIRVETVHQYQNGLMRTVWAIRPDGEITITLTLPPKGYGVSWRFPVTCRQVTEEMRDANLIRRFPERLAWRKNGLWTWYPEDHLGRNSGISSLMNPHDPQNHAMKMNAGYVSIGPTDKSINMVIRDPQARIHVKSHLWYNEFEVFVQGRLEDDYDYFDRTNPLKALPHALSEQQRTYSFKIQFVDQLGLEALELRELDHYEVLISRSEFWDRFVDELQVEDMRGTVKGLSPEYRE